MSIVCYWQKKELQWWISNGCDIGYVEHACDYII